MNKKTKEKITMWFVMFTFAFVYFVLGFVVCFLVAMNSADNNILGQWFSVGGMRFIKVRIDNVALGYNISEIVNHEIGHEIYHLMYGINSSSKENEDFARVCEKDINYCVGLYLNSTGER